MRITDVKKLGKGDQVYWNDPAPDGCSRIFNINTITVYPGGVVHICDDLGEVECYARELQAGLPPNPKLNYCQHKGCKSSIEGWADKCEKHNGSLWDNNEIQFARLLCELVATCDDLKLRDCCESMDINQDELNELYDRAHAVWEASKAKHSPVRR